MNPRIESTKKKPYKFAPMLIGFIFLVTIGCTPPQDLTFEIPLSQAFRVIDVDKYKGDEVIIIASAEEVAPPPGIEFSDSMLESLREIDFDHFFAILIPGSRNPDKLEITKITRKGDRVTVSMNFNVVMGDYALRDYTKNLSVNTKGASLV